MANPKERFETVMRVAQWLSDGENSVNALLALARMVGREFVYKLMLNEVKPAGGPGLTPVVGWRSLANKYGITQQPGSGEQVWLEWDVVVAQPWSDGRLADALEGLSRGPAGKSKEWRFDPMNHKIALWLPMRLAEVWGGNHSIAAGVLSNIGKVPATATFDLSPLYERLTEPRVWVDGSEDWVFWEKDGGPTGVNVGDWRLGLLFEIGRLLHQHGFNGRFGDNWHP